MPAPPLLSAAIIVRDEAEFLRSCLASIREVCDQIVVVDTGSEDESVDVARSFGADVGFHQWNNDFSAARNVSLDMALGEWVLYIDADEQLVDPDVDACRSELAAATDAVALRVLFRVQPGFTPYREFRLWRHVPSIRFFSQIHETIVPGILRYGRANGLSVRESEYFSIVHYGYEGDQSHKHRRNLPLLESWLKESPNRCYLWDHLGQVKMALGDRVGAFEAWNTGLALIRERGIAEAPDLSIYSSLCREYIEQGVDISELLAELRECAPRFRLTDWFEARHLQNSGHHREAIGLLDSLIDAGEGGEDSAFGYDTRVFGEFAWAAKGTSFFVLGEWESALEAFLEAQRCDPSNVEYSTKITAIRSLLQTRSREA